MNEAEARKIRNGIGYALLFSLISFYIIFKGISGISFKTSFAGIDWAYIGIGFLVLGIVWTAKAYRMYVITLGMGAKIGLFRYLQIYLATCFIAHITPFNSGGTPLQIYLLHKQGINLGKATAITVVDLGLNTAMFLFLIPIALVINIFIVKGNSYLQMNTPVFQWLARTFSLVVVLFLLSWRLPVWKYVKELYWFRQFRVFLIKKGWWKKLKQELILFREGWLILFRHNRMSIFWAIIATIVYWIFYLMLAPLIIWAMGKPVSFLSLIGWQLLFNFAQILIPTPGGSGGSELILMYLFKSLVGATRVGTFVLLWKIYTFFSSLILGGVYFLYLTRKSESQ